ncbi:hypothetical protein C2S53_020522 [Perilla frutescens var. hirtella]|uniref:Uncharacterized protein n=1 Tax=Perilla frutescens var. hirtella TaxID=608512 RepID=A0AAD4P817_PERFH|nr:hypothetical protein C2S53_020522 [Perilla frutescens var. hirtella]
MSELWPPQWKVIKKCPQYIYGLIDGYMEELEIEKFEHLDDVVYYGPRCIGKSSGKAHQTLKRFLKQVRESRGYDVDCFPPSVFRSPFIPVTLSEAMEEEPFYLEGVMKSTCFAVKEINAQAKKHGAGTRYELKDLEKIVDTCNLATLLTFTVKEFVSCSGADSDGDDGHVVKTVQAMVYIPPGKDLKLIEWRFKPAELLDSAEVSPESSDAAQVSPEVSDASQGSDASDKSP